MQLPEVNMVETQVKDFKLVSKGRKYAQVIVIHPGNIHETRHLQFNGSCWRDNFGNIYEI